MTEFVAGLIGGTSGLVIGHPLDTVKALVQSRDHKSMRNSIKILLHESNKTGLGFFRGLSLPFITYGPLNSLLFGVYGLALKILDPSAGAEPTLKNVFIAGTIAGTVCAIPTNPLELVKIQLQTHTHKQISGVWECLANIYKSNGFRGYFRGFPVILMRDSFPFGFYFYLFEWMRREGKRHRIDSPIFVDLVCGGLTGSITWLSVMPIDVVKTCMQADREDRTSARQRVKQLWQTEGIKGFFKGTQPLLIRAFIVNAVTFCVYVQTLEFLNGFYLKDKEIL